MFAHHPKGFWFRHDAIMLSDASVAVLMILLAGVLVFLLATATMSPLL